MKYSEIMKYDSVINEKAALGSPAAGPPTSHHGVMRWSVLTRIKWPTSCGCCSFRLFGNHRPRLKAVSCEGMSLTRSWTKGDASCRKSDHERNEILMNINFLKYKQWILWILFSMFGWITPLLSQIKLLLSRRAYHLARPAICGLCFRVPSSIQTPCHPCVFHQWTTEPQPGQRFFRFVLRWSSELWDNLWWYWGCGNWEHITRCDKRSTEGTKPAAAGLPLLHHAEAPGILEKIGFRKVLKAKLLSGNILESKIFQYGPSISNQLKSF